MIKKRAGFVLHNLGASSAARGSIFHYFNYILQTVIYYYSFAFCAR